MALPVRADIERLSRFAGEVTGFVEFLEPRTVTIWIGALPAELREEPSFRALVADLEGLRQHRSRFEQMVARLQRQMHHLRDYLASVEYSYLYAHRASAVPLAPVDYRAICPQRYLVTSGEYAVPDAYALRSRACTMPDPGALERILDSWYGGSTRTSHGGSRGLDGRVTAPDGGTSDRRHDYGESAGDPPRYSR